MYTLRLTYTGFAQQLQHDNHILSNELALVASLLSLWVVVVTLVRRLWQFLGGTRLGRSSGVYSSIRLLHSIFVVEALARVKRNGPTS